MSSHCVPLDTYQQLPSVYFEDCGACSKSVPEWRRIRRNLRAGGAELDGLTTPASLGSGARGQTLPAGAQAGAVSGDGQQRDPLSGAEAGAASQVLLVTTGALIAEAGREQDRQ